MTTIKITENDTTATGVTSWDIFDGAGNFFAATATEADAREIAVKLLGADRLEIARNVVTMSFDEFMAAAGA